MCVFLWIPWKSHLPIHFSLSNRIMTFLEAQHLTLRMSGAIQMDSSDVRRFKEKVLCSSLYHFLSRVSSMLLPSTDIAFWLLPIWFPHQQLSRGLQTFPAGLGLLEHPTSWTDHLLCSQPLQCADGHCWTSQPYGYKPLQSIPFIMHIHSMGSVLLDNPALHRDHLQCSLKTPGHFPVDHLNTLFYKKPL